MNNLHDTTMDRLLDLLAARATEGLNAAESAELEQLLQQHPQVDEFQFDSAAAVLASAFASPESSAALPPSVQQKIMSQIDAASSLRVAPPLRVSDDSRNQAATLPIRSTPRPSVFGNMGWLAAAACLGLAIFAWLPKLKGPQTLDSNTVARFAQTHADSFSISWADFNALDTQEPPELRNVTGQVTWSDAAQSGYMRFSNLPKNDPSQESYQLWIVDAERGLSQRVSGAVFNASSTGETIVEIQPQLPISKAAVFAVTIERPGGVVVSDMSRRVTLAARPKS